MQAEELALQKEFEGHSEEPGTLNGHANESMVGKKERPVLDHVVTANSRAALEFIDTDFHFPALSITPLQYGRKDMAPLRWSMSDKWFADESQLCRKESHGLRYGKPHSGIMLEGLW